MATLQQTLRGLPQADDQLARGPGGVLQRAPTLQEAAKAAGITAAPTTPMAAQMTGAGAQSAKMAGTPQQMQAALQRAGETPTLQTALRQKQYGRALTGAETGAMAKSVDMQKLGGLGDRVTKMVENEYKKTIDANVQLSADLDIVEKATDLNAPEVMQAMKRIAQSVGKPLDEIDWATLVPDMKKSIAASAQSAMRQSSEIPIAEVVSQLGYDIPTLSQLLGVPENVLQTYSIEQLQDRVNLVSSEEFTRAQQLQQQAVSPWAGAAERGLAREAGRELSTVGISSTEADVQRLADELSGADQVSLMGETKSYADWLADDEISALIKEVVDSPADSQIRKDLKNSSPDFYNFIERNETTLKTASANIQTGATNFKAIQDFNKNLYRSVNLNDDAAKIYAPTLTGLADKKYSEEDSSTIKYLKSLSDQDREQASNILNDLALTDKATAEEIAKLTPEELTALGIGKPDSNWAKRNKYNASLDQLTKIPENDYDSLVRQAFTDVTSISEAQNRIAEGKKLNALGLDSGISTTSLDPSTLKKDLLAGKSKLSLADAVSGNIPETVKKSLGAVKYPAPGSAEEGILSKVGTLLEDGSLSSQDIYSGAANALTLDEFIKLEDLSKNGKSSIDQQAITNRRQHASNVYTRQQFTETRGGSSALDTAARLAESDPSGRKIDKKLLSYFVEQEIAPHARDMVRIVKGYGSLDQVPKMWRGLVDIALNQLEKAVRADVASPEMYKAYYDIRGPVSFSM